MTIRDKVLTFKSLAEASSSAGLHVACSFLCVGSAPFGIPRTSWADVLRNRCQRMSRSWNAGNEETCEGRRGELCWGFSSS